MFARTKKRECRETDSFFDLCYFVAKLLQKLKPPNFSKK